MVNQEEAIQGSVKIALEFEGEIFDIDLLAKAARNLRTLLKDIEETITGESPRATWEWDEPVLRAVASPNGATEATLLRVAHEARETFGKAEEQPLGRVSWPKTLSPKGQRAAKEIVNLLNKVDAITVVAEREEPVTLKRPELAATEIRRTLGYQEHSSVEGVLDIISVRRRPHFSVRQHAGLAVQCIFPDSMIDEVKAALGGRVVVEGLVRYRSDGSPVSISNVTSLKVKAPPVRPIHELRGSLPYMTQGMAAGEYIRRLREGTGGDAD